MNTARKLVQKLPKWRCFPQSPKNGLSLTVCCRGTLTLFRQLCNLQASGYSHVHCIHHQKVQSQLSPAVFQKSSVHPADALNRKPLDPNRRRVGWFVVISCSGGLSLQRPSKLDPLLARPHAIPTSSFPPLYPANGEEIFILKYSIEVHMFLLYRQLPVSSSVTFVPLMALITTSLPKTQPF